MGSVILSAEIRCRAEKKKDKRCVLFFSGEDLPVRLVLSIRFGSIRDETDIYGRRADAQTLFLL